MSPMSSASESGELSSLLSGGERPVSSDTVAPSFLVATPPLGYASLLFCTMCMAVDYSVVMPSLWLFLRSLDPDVPEAVLGVALGEPHSCPP